MFLFPSSGTAFLNHREQHQPLQMGDGLQVSIPFKREGVSELKVLESLKTAAMHLFLFPSTGKAFLNKVSFGLSGPPTRLRFYSLPPGRRF